MFPQTNIEDYIGETFPLQEGEGTAKNQEFQVFSSDREYDGTFTYKMNSQGFRGPEPDVGQLISVGCSICQGVGVAEEDRASTLIANKLKLKDINLAWHGKSIDYCYRMLNWAVPNLNPKFVFVQSPAIMRREYLCRYAGTYDFTAKNVPPKTLPTEIRLEREPIYQKNMELNPGHYEMVYFNYATAIENLLERYQVDWMFLIPKKAPDNLTHLLESRCDNFLRLRGSIDLGRDKMHPGPESHSLWAKGVLHRHRGEEIPHDYFPPKS